MMRYMNVQWDQADRLRKAMRHAGLTSGDVAARLEVSRNAVSSWITGRHKPRPRDLRAFARITGYSAEWLATGDLPDEGAQHAA